MEQIIRLGALWILFVTGCATRTEPPPVKPQAPERTARKTAAGTEARESPVKKAGPAVKRADDPLQKMIGVNLAGGEFGKLPGRFGKEYIYPNAKQFAYYRSKGMVVVRLPFKWERIQREAMGPLDEDEIKRLDAVAALACEHGMALLLDMHNYAYYQGKLIGSPELPDKAFADVWRKLAGHFKDEKGVWAYGLMNEPKDTKGRWRASAQAAVDAIRTVDRKHSICVCGEGWSGAHSWKKINSRFLLHDPEDRLIYEAHQYFDRDNSGTYKQGYDQSGAHPDIGVERLKPFAEWLRENDARGFIGEFGVPAEDRRWLEVLDRFLAEMERGGIGGAYWAGGPWWGKYPLAIEPKDGQDRPQMKVLGKYFDSKAGRTRRP